MFPGFRPALAGGVCKAAGMVPAPLGHPCPAVNSTVSACKLSKKSFVWKRRTDQYSRACEGRGVANPAEAGGRGEGGSERV